jgi:UDP-N-acetyl-D-mannosaminuronate dehydrogenase
VNELALIFQRLEIDTLDVLEAAGTTLPASRLPATNP